MIWGYFLPFRGLYFQFVVSFDKVFNFDKPNLFSFPLVTGRFCVISKKALPNLRMWRHTPAILSLLKDAPFVLFISLLKFIPNSCQPKNKKLVQEAKHLFGIKNYNSGYTGLSRNPSDVLIIGGALKFFYGKKKD